MPKTLLLLTLSLLAVGQTNNASAVSARLAAEADRFAKYAPGLTARETLRQTLFGSSPPPGGKKSQDRTREVQSIYALVQTMNGIREFRQVASIDGKSAKAASHSLERVAESILASTPKQQKKMLEQFEKNGLTGIATDFGQILLLFASGSGERFELAFARADQLEGDPVSVYRFQQIDGDDSLTIFEDKGAIKQKMNGEVWVRAQDQLPRRIVFGSARSDKTRNIKDVGVVDYRPSGMGLLLPERVIHQQFVDNRMYVEDKFTYSDFKRTGAAPAQ